MKEKTDNAGAGTLAGFKAYSAYIWKENKKSYLLSFLFFPAFIAANYVQIYLPKLAVKELEEGQTILHLGISVLGVIVLLMVSVTLRERILARIRIANRKLVQKMSNDYAEKMLYVDYGYLEDPEFLTLRNKAKESLFGGSIGDGNTGQARLHIFLETCNNTIAVAGNLLLYGWYLFCLQPWLVPVLIITNSAMFLVNQTQKKYENRYSKELSDVWQKLDYASRKAGDFAMAKDIRLYGMQDWLYGMINKYSRERMGYKAKDMRIGMADSAIFALISGCFYACFYGCVLHALWNGSMKISDVVFYAGMGPALYHMTDWDLIHNVQMLIRTSLAFNRFESFINYGENTGKKDVALQRKAPMLELENVSFAYPGAKKAVLADFNLRIMPGEKLAVVGVNGAGKTTLMKLICGLLHPTKGQILLDGKDMAEMDAEDRYAHFSCAFQEIQFLPLSIRDNIACDPVSAVDERIWECLKQAGMEEAVRNLPKGLDSKLEKSIHEDAVDFSGGQKQKLILAKALYREAGVLILDEPTAALDALAENEIYEKYARFADGKTSFFVSHRLSSTRFCDRIILIDGGRLAEQGTHDELMQQDGLYAKMFRLQSHYYK